MQLLSTCEADENSVEALLQAEGRDSERVERRLAAARNNRRMHFQPRECWDLQVASFARKPAICQFATAVTPLKL